MDSVRHYQHQSDKSEFRFCVLCLAKPGAGESLVEIHSGEGLQRSLETLIRRYFTEEVPRVDAGFVCSVCCRHLDSFHQFYLRIKDIQWNRKMRTSVDERNCSSLEHGLRMEMTIKEEKPDEGFENFGSSAEVEGLNNFLEEQFAQQTDQNGNGPMQNRLLDTIVNEFQASSIHTGGDTGECSNHQYPKRVRREVPATWEENNPRQQELEFLEEELYEYDKPPDEQIQTQHSVTLSPMEELERLRRENEWLKRRNHHLVARLRDVHARNDNLVQINRELTHKLRSVNPNALSKPIPTIQENICPAEVPIKHVQINPTQASPSPSLILPQNEEPPKLISLCSAYSLDNGDVVVCDSIIPARTMEEIDTTERGEKYDLKFVSRLAVALWGHERLAVSSVTGRKSNNNPSSNPMPTIQLEPEKLSFIKEKVYNRAILETNDRLQAMARFEDARINRLLNIKIQNTKRKKTPHSPSNIA
ncbi:uncharacterized protein LOC6038533 [Culex quinquefasciatus]|uniref:uncharacterized protein LOC6038533 n=1 Tax=Culex quinquefasciatus TaxID=7176 RepID=UPI0018E31342|nr:uncharacterized protein LOC6038533 [Culex quinquefasciatus]